jgi:hypothetical protein
MTRPERAAAIDISLRLSARRDMTLFLSFATEPALVGPDWDGYPDPVPRPTDTTRTASLPTTHGSLPLPRAASPGSSSPKGSTRAAFGKAGRSDRATARLENKGSAVGPGPCCAVAGPPAHHSSEVKAPAQPGNLGRTAAA